MQDNSISHMLQRRGFEILKANPKENLIFPSDWNSAFEDELYEMLKKYSFRIFIRDVIKYKKSFGVDNLLKYSTREWVERYITFLLNKNIAEKLSGEKYKLKSSNVFSFGDTLEWFVARVFEKEFSLPALWGVSISGGKAGGDYDVIACLEGQLVYVEVKSSPPKNVEEIEIKAFLDRIDDLVPSMAIFLEDTQLRMKDKIAPFFEKALKKKRLKVKRLHEEIFCAKDRLFIINSSPDIINNLGFCIRHYLSAKGFW